MTGQKCQDSGLCPWDQDMYGESGPCVQIPHPRNVKHKCEHGHPWGTHPAAYDPKTTKTYESFLQEFSAEQPMPHGQGTPVAERLIALIRERTRLGVEKYGEPLTTHNGRDSTLDSLQESVDLNQYLMKIIMEREDEIKPLADYLLSIGGPDRDESACEMAVRLLKGFEAGRSANRNAVI